MNLKLIVKISPEEYMTNGTRHMLHSELSHNGKIYCKQELLEEDMLKSYFDRIFDYAKQNIKDHINKENK